METEGNYSSTTMSNLLPGNSCVVTFTPEGCYYGTPPINYKPKRIVIDGKITACYFEDGEKVVVRCGNDDPYIEEVGVAMAIVKKLYGHRNKYKKAIAKAERPVHTEKKKVKKV